MDRDQCHQRSNRPSHRPGAGGRKQADIPKHRYHLHADGNRVGRNGFDYNRHNLRPDAEKPLLADAKTLGEILRQYPNYKLTVQGYCDEHGSEEYNLALGDKRATQAKDYLVSMGIPGAQLKTISYGKERQVCTEHNEACWQRNRRAHITQEQ